LVSRSPGQLIDESSLEEISKSHPDFGISGYVFASSYVGKADRVLDIGCGIGSGSAILLNAGAGKVTGVDINPKAIEYARDHYHREGLDFLCLSAADLPFLDGFFDLVVAMEIIEHLPESQHIRFLKECSRVLKNGGKIVCSTPNRRAYSIPSLKRSLNRSHLKEYDIDEFHDLLDDYFGDVTLYGQTFYSSTGIINHKLIMLAQFMVGGVLSLFPKADKLKLSVYAAITRIRLRFQTPLKKTQTYQQEADILPLADKLSRQPLDVIAVARIVK
jgi:SAM-dependent methyltransferase